MIKQLLAVLAVIALGLGLTAGAAFASVDGCPDSGGICFYNWENFDTRGGIYTQTQAPINSCRVLPVSGVAGWTNGKVYNATTSILLNWTGGNTAQRTIYWYDNNACTGANFVSVVYPGQLYQLPALRLVGDNWNDRIGSFKVL